MAMYFSSIQSTHIFMSQLSEHGVDFQWDRVDQPSDAAYEYWLNTGEVATHVVYVEY